MYKGDNTFAFSQNLNIKVQQLICSNTWTEKFKILKFKNTPYYLITEKEDNGQ